MVKYYDNIGRKVYLPHSQTVVQVWILLAVLFPTSIYKFNKFHDKYTEIQNAK
jgi:hypothetical protein